MSSISVRVKMGDFISSLQQWTQELSANVDARTQEAGINVHAQARIACPVGTPESTHKKGYHGGRLRNSIAYANRGYGHSEVFSEVYYADFVENGHRTRNGGFVAGRFMLTNAFINERATWKQDLKDMCQP